MRAFSIAVIPAKAGTFQRVQKEGQSLFPRGIGKEGQSPFLKEGHSPVGYGVTDLPGGRSGLAEPAGAVEAQLASSLPAGSTNRIATLASIPDGAQRQAKALATARIAASRAAASGAPHGPGASVRPGRTGDWPDRVSCSESASAISMPPSELFLNLVQIDVRPAIESGGKVTGSVRLASSQARLRRRGRARSTP